MTIGIYILRFKGTDKVYIGQSINIEDRFKSHKVNMRMNKAVKKLQEAYILYGEPTQEILTECNKDSLDILENETIDIFDAINNGFNTMKEAGYTSSLYGDACGNAKYSNEQILEVFNYLTLCPNMTHAEIVSITDISRGVVSDISSMKTHRWLKDRFPEQYKVLEELSTDRRKLRRTAISRGKVYPPIKSPDGSTYTIASIRGFAREHGLNYSALGRVLRGQADSHAGWVLA